MVIIWQFTLESKKTEIKLQPKKLCNKEYFITEATGNRKSRIEKKLCPYNTLLLMKMKNKGVDIYLKLLGKNNNLKEKRKKN